MELSEGELRAVGSWAADCAERVLPLFESKAPSDARPREAIEGIRVFARGERRTARLRVLALAAHAAASAYLHPLATLDQAKHVLGPAVYAALARELAAGGNPGAAEEEIRWAVEHASPAVREVLGRMPARDAGRSRLGALYRRLDASLRS